MVGDEVITQNELRSRLAAGSASSRSGDAPCLRTTCWKSRCSNASSSIGFSCSRPKGNRHPGGRQPARPGHHRIAAGNKMTPASSARPWKDGIAYARFREEIREEMTMARLREREGRQQAGDFRFRWTISSPTRPPKAASRNTNSPTSCCGRPVGQPEQLQKLRTQGRAGVEAGAGRRKLRRTERRLFRCARRAPGRQSRRPALDRLPALYAEAAAKLKPGEVGDLLRSPAGFHIIKLIAKQGGTATAPVQQTRARHILIRINEIVSEGEARRKLENLRERLVHGGDFVELARLYSQDGSAAKGATWVVNPATPCPNSKRPWTP